uniref:Elicitin n=1 Tax=Globisporangium ultimum (strain ATCC 200006 / CBS 805.95 / DAOM BR144) TaxID=431595 RepID=K3XBH0_GLOUD
MQLSVEDAISASLRVNPVPSPRDSAAPAFVPASVLVAPATTTAPANLGTTAPPGVVSETEVAPANTLSPAPTTYRNVTSDMKLVINAVGQVMCPEEVRKNSFAIYKNNKAMFDTCTKESKYQLLPHEEGVPTPEQTTALVTVPACVDLFSGIILADFPECDINNFSIRSASESLFRIRKDVLAGRGAPSQLQFDEFYNLNRVMNLLAENASLIESVFSRHANRISLSEMTRMLNRIEVDPAVSISDNMTISVARSDRPAPSPSTDAAASGSTEDGVTVIYPSRTVLSEVANGTANTTKSAANDLRSSAWSFCMWLLVMILGVVLWS